MTAETSRNTPLSVPGTEPPPAALSAELAREVIVDCGWGRLIFGQTFADPAPIAAALRSEELGQRDIAMYVRDPHVVVAQAPQELFVDPSYTYRLWLDANEPSDVRSRVHVRKMASQSDGDEMNRVFAENGMVTAPPSVMWERQRSGALIYLVAVDLDDGRVVGTVMGVDHKHAFNDPERGSSLWTLCVSPHCRVSGVGETLARALAADLRARGCAYLDLSVMYDNAGAIALYDKLGFTRVPVFAVKRKNPINEPLFAHTPGTDYEKLNPYGRIIADEARRRGILVEILDAEFAILRLSHGGRVITMRESLSELTTAVAMTRCDDKRITRRSVSRADIRIPTGRMATFDERDRAFLAAQRELVVKPVRGEQGRGVSVGVTVPDELERALERAAAHCPEVLLEQCVHGEDLRLVVIDHAVVAASIRRPARVVGTGRHTVEELIGKQSRRRQRATGGESRIPITDATRERHDPRRHRAPAPRARRGGDARDTRARDPGVRDRLHRARRRTPRVRDDRGQRAARPRQPRAAADGAALYRPPVPRDPGTAGGLGSEAGNPTGAARMTGGRRAHHAAHRRSAGRPRSTPRR
jgi:GNAT-family acetyltransferase (TIGR03103 family)